MPVAKRELARRDAPREIAMEIDFVEHALARASHEGDEPYREWLRGLILRLQNFGKT